MAPVQIKFLQEKDLARWDGFVDGCPSATFFHRAGWKSVIENAFGHDTYFMYAEADGEIQGVIPLGHVKSLLFGNSLISTPFGVYGGIAANNEQAAAALEAAAVQTARRLKVDYLEMRNVERRKESWDHKELYVTFRKEMEPEVDKNLAAIPRKQRAMVRKGIKAGLISELDEGVERFFDMYSQSVRNLGTPVLPKRYFQLLREVFGKTCEVLTVTKDGRPVSSVLSFYFRDQVLPYYGGGGSGARQYKANDFMYWELIRRSCERGIRWFDYGRSKKGTGSYSFKKNWGFKPEPLHYEYLRVRAAEIPDLNPLNPKYRLFIDLWKRLPLSVSRTLGPMLAKHLA